MSDDSDRLRRIARQEVRTNQLLGVDFVPVRHAPAAPAPPPAASGAEQAWLSFDGPPEALSTDRKPEALEALQARHDAECPHCTQATAHTRTVFGEGNPDAALMFIGEAPGEQEDRTGRPFVGRAGRKLEEMIEAIGMQRAGVYIANILKSRPPGNRTPLPGEVEGCSPFLAEQIRIIRPVVIVALGGPASKWLLRTTEGITRIRGQWRRYFDGPLSISVMPTFHPAYLLRNYTLDTRGKVWSDLRSVVTRLGEEGG